jgi:pimeloyl-ACP methyl ester carboxylesterase
MSFLQNVFDGDAPFSNATELISGSYEIKGRLCQPSWIIPGLLPTLEVLVHGLGYNHAYWSGLNLEFISSNGSSYSWVAYARAQGYYTLAIDRLGSSGSSRPDPVRVLQPPIEVEVLHSIISQMRQGTIYSPAFERIVYVGHSYGSYLGNHLAAIYPDDADDLVLTGWSALSGEH